MATLKVRFMVKVPGPVTKVSACPVAPVLLVQEFVLLVHDEPERCELIVVGATL